MNRITVARLVLTAFIWGLNFHLAKLAVGPLPFEIVALLRYTIASLCFGALSPVAISELRASLKAHGWHQFLLALVGIFGYSVLFFLAIPHTSPVNAALIMATTPLFTVLISALWLHTRVRKQQWIGLVMGLIGVLLIISQGRWEVLWNLRPGYGDVLLLLNSALFAFTNVFNRKYLSQSNPNTTAALTTHMTTLLCGILVGLSGSTLSWDRTTPAAWMAAIALGALGSFLAHRFWYQGIQAAGADRSAYFLNLVPFFAALIAVLRGTALSGSQWAGGALIISGILISLSKKSRYETDKTVLVRCKA